MRFEPGEDFARRLDAEDPLRALREQFHFPEARPGVPAVYLTGHSLGLQPKKAKDYVARELAEWARLGVRGHHEARDPWVPYHELLTEPMARIVGALPSEIVVMNSVSVNLHLMLVSFYRPTPARHRVLIEAGAFPSDRYAVASQIRLHGHDPKEALLEIGPRPGEESVRPEDLLALIEKEGPGLALVLLGNVNYLTGQAFDTAAVTAAAHRQGCAAGFDLAHGAGNLALALHDWDVDFAVWCGERHHRDATLPRLAGWWGHDKKTRWAMPQDFDPIPGAEAWQLSNPPILQLAALRASMELFDAATMPALRKKGEALTGYLEFLLGRLPEGVCRQVTPREPAQRGSQLSLRVREKKDALLARLQAQGIVCDVREPDVVRAAPVPLCTRFEDVQRFAAALDSNQPAAR
ncbi:MAG: kynureninase [Elusimicrobia bacterium]|nr:MAG: kynureninase [Elusimicrobiota bacterium]